MTERFPYEESRWAKGADAEVWLAELENLGPKNIRAVLAQTDVGSAGAVMIGVKHITKGFAQEWLNWHDRRAAAKEDRLRSQQIFWTRWAAIAASLAAAAATVGWFLTVYFR